MNTKLHAVTDTNGRPVRLFITAGQVSDYTGAAALMNGLPEAEWLLADRGYDADWFRETLVDKGTKPCIPGRKSRKKAVNKTSAVTNDATVSRECSEGSKMAPRRNSLRQITNSLPLRNRSRRNRHILVMSPDPRLLLVAPYQLWTEEWDKRKALEKPDVDQRWSQDFGPVVKVDRLVKEVIPNDETKEPFVPLPGSRYAVSMRGEFQGQGCA
jgi:transposase